MLQNKFRWNTWIGSLTNNVLYIQSFSYRKKYCVLFYSLIIRGLCRVLFKRYLYVGLYVQYKQSYRECGWWDPHWFNSWPHSVTNYLVSWPAQLLFDHIYDVCIQNGIFKSILIYVYGIEQILLLTIIWCNYIIF